MKWGIMAMFIIRVLYCIAICAFCRLQELHLLKRKISSQHLPLRVKAPVKGNVYMHISLQQKY